MSEADEMSVDLEKARRLDEQLSEEDINRIALGQLVSQIGLTPEEQDRTDIGLVEASFRTVEVINRLGERVAELEDRVDKIDRTADTALTVAETQAEPAAEVSKKRVAMLTTRNELLRATAVDRSQTSGASVEIADVQEMAKPETKLYHQTVIDSWDELAADWEAFSIGGNEAGNTVCRVEPDDLDPRLVKTVESALGRDDLAKRLLSSAERGAV